MSQGRSENSTSAPLRQAKIVRDLRDFVGIRTGSSTAVLPSGAARGGCAGPDSARTLAEIQASSNAVAQVSG
jgi:hypothetical protein